MQTQGLCLGFLICKYGECGSIRLICYSKIMGCHNAGHMATSHSGIMMVIGERPACPASAPF